MTNRTRYRLEEIQRNTFYQLPQFLFNEEFKELSNDARVLYSLLRNRHDLSIKNRWINEHNEVYLIFSRERMGEVLNLSNKTVIKVVNELKKYNLIEEQRRGQGKPNLIYLLTVENLDNTEPCKNSTSNNEKNPSQHVDNLHANNTYINKTYYSDNSSSLSSSLSLMEESELSTKEEKKNRRTTMTNDTDNNHEQNKSMEMKKELSKTTATPSIGSQESSQSTCDDYTTYKSIIQDNIEYDPDHPDAKLIDELVDCMLDVICTNEDTVKINGEEKNRNLVKDQYLKINYFDIDHVLYRYKSQYHKITHLHSYLKTMLYTVKQENGHYYTNAVRADGIVN